MVSKQADNSFAQTLASDNQSRTVVADQLSILQKTYNVQLNSQEMGRIMSQASGPRQSDQQTRAKVADGFADALKERGRHGDANAMALANQIAGQRMDAQTQSNTNSQNQIVTLTCQIGNRTFEISSPSDQSMQAAVRRANDPASSSTEANQNRNNIWLHLDTMDPQTRIQEVTPGHNGPINPERFTSIRSNYEANGFRMSIPSVRSGNRDSID